MKSKIVYLSKCLFTFSLFVSFVATAETCKVSSRSTGEATDENFVVTFNQNDEVMVLATFMSREEQRHAVHQVLDQDMDYPKTLKALEAIYSSKKDREAISNLPSTVDFIARSLGAEGQKDIDYVVVNQTQNTFKQVEVSARFFGALIFGFGNQQDRMIPVADRRKQLDPFTVYAQATVGAASFVHGTRENLFNGVEFSYLEPADPLLKASDASDARLKELLEAFQDRRARKNLKDAARRLKNGGYAKYTNAQIKADIIDRFHKRTRDKIGSWVDLALEEKPTPAKIAEQKQSKLVEALMNKRGKGLVLVPHSRLKKEMAAFKEACAR